MNRVGSNCNVLQLCIPDWKYFNKNPISWLPAEPTATTAPATKAEPKKETTQKPKKK